MKYGIAGYCRRTLNRRHVFKQAYPLILLAFLIGCSPMKPTRDDPLIGKIFSSSSKQQITYKDLFKGMLHADVVYLGENHDNAGHHYHQMQIIKELIKQGKKPIIGFEFFSVDQTGHLMTFVAGQSSKHPTIVDKKRESLLRNDLGWLNRSDTSWQFYFQFIKLAAENKLTIFGADLPAGIVRRITRNGLDKLTKIEKEFLRSTHFKDDTYRDLMFERFKASHCGFAHQKMMEKMYDAWLARNDAMAHSITAMAKTSPNQPIVVILGKGHVENNMAVYERVKHRMPEIKQVNLGFTEIAVNPTPVEHYFQTTSVGDKSFPPAFEYFWFTQRTSYEDPCERFREQLKRMKNHGKK